MPSDSPSGSRWDLIPARLDANNTIVRLKRPDDCVVARFSESDWHKIFTDIDTDAQLNAFLRRNPRTVRAYILEDAADGSAFGWICLRRRDEILCDTVEFHGGAWRGGFRASKSKFAAACAVIDAALRSGIRVSSRAYADNAPALRFLHALGFKTVERPSGRPYRTLTLSRGRFYQSAIYRELSRSASISSEAQMKGPMPLGSLSRTGSER